MDRVSYGGFDYMDEGRNVQGGRHSLPINENAKSWQRHSLSLSLSARKSAISRASSVMAYACSER